MRCLVKHATRARSATGARGHEWVHIDDISLSAEAPVPGCSGVVPLLVAADLIVNATMSQSQCAAQDSVQRRGVCLAFV